VRDGLEIGRLVSLNGEWQGRAEWLLIVDASLLHLVGVLQQGSRVELQVQQRLVPLSTLRDPVLTTTHQQQAQQVYLRSVELRVLFHEGEISVAAELPDRNVDRILTFTRSLNAARG
jgi:hypothetical protein